MKTWELIKIHAFIYHLPLLHSEFSVVALYYGMAKLNAWFWLAVRHSKMIMFQQLNDCKVVPSLHYSSTSRHHIIKVISDRLTACRHKRKGFISLLGNKVASEDKLGVEKVYEMDSKLEFCLRHLREISLRTSAHPHVFPSLWHSSTEHNKRSFEECRGQKNFAPHWDIHLLDFTEVSQSHWLKMTCVNEWIKSFGENFHFGQS